MLALILREIIGDFYRFSKEITCAILYKDDTWILEVFMSFLLLENRLSIDTLVVPGYFIDRFLPAASGTDVKVYLYLLALSRHQPLV